MRIIYQHQSAKISINQRFCEAKSMGHKVHPKIYRIGITTNWSSQWFSRKKIPEYLEEDFKIHQFLEKRLAKLGVGNIEIERFPDKVNVIISTMRPGLIIGRKGLGAETLKKDLEKAVRGTKGSKKGPEIKIDIKEIREPWTHAGLCAQWVAAQLEKRTPFRRALKQVLSKITAYKTVKGARVEVAGRLNGAEIARTEWLKKGQLPRQTLRADIDYGTARAHCSYGTIGVKVWIYKGEKF